MDGRREGKNEGRKDGRKKGNREGREKGKKKGRKVKGDLMLGSILEKESNTTLLTYCEDPLLKIILVYIC